MDILSKINCKNTSISLLFHAGRSLISSPNFARVTTSANLISPGANLENKDDTSSSILLPNTFLFVVFFQLAPDVFNAEPVDKVQR